jgi:CheY-like chemotaxis protein
VGFHGTIAFGIFPIPGPHRPLVISWNVESDSNAQVSAIKVQFHSCRYPKQRRCLRVKLLLVDDSRTLRRENQRALERVGYEVICAEDGETALRIAREQPFDLILLDLMLPKMSGIEVLRRLKSEASTAAIPVVVLSSLSEKNRARLIAAGAEEYLEKSSLMPQPGQNLLPLILEDVVCRIHRKRGIAFTDVHTSH